MEKNSKAESEGFKLSIARRQAGFTQKKLAEIVEVTPKWISDIEIGKAKASPQLAKKIEEVLTKELSKEQIRIFEKF